MLDGLSGGRGVKAGKAFLTHLSTTEDVTSSTGGARAGGSRAGGGAGGGAAGGAAGGGAAGGGKGHSGKVECALYLQKRSGGCQLQ